MLLQAVAVEPRIPRLQPWGVVNDFRKRVIDTAVDEINAVSDLRVAYEPTRTGRSITHIKFSITKARSNP